MGDPPSAQPIKPPSPSPGGLRRLIFLTRLFHALGFRWVFVWTMPIPYHPLVPIVMIVAVPLLIAQRVVAVVGGGTGGVTSGSLVGGAGVIALLLTIPIVNWFAMVFRLPLIQGMLIGGAMILTAVDVAAGRASPWVAAFPIGFVALYLMQRIAGPPALRALERANAAFTPVDPGGRQVVFEGDTVAGSYGSWLIRNCDLAEVLVTPCPRQYRGIVPMDQQYARLPQGDVAAVRDALEAARTSGWSVSDDGILAMPAASPRPDAMRIRTRRHRSPLWLLAGDRLTLEIDCDGRRQRLVGGNAAPVGNVPLFVFFRWIAIFGGNSHWVVGFARTKPVVLGPSRIYDMLERALPPLPGGGATRFAATDGLIAEMTRRADDNRAEAREALAQLIATVGDDDPAYVSTYELLRYPEVVAGQGERLCDALLRAKQADDQRAAIVFARLLGALSDEEFAALSDRLIALLNSKTLAFRLLGGDDPDLVNAPRSERDKHVIGGFRLVHEAPRLYERLGELGEPARVLILGLGKVGRWPDPLKTARDELDARQSG